jgi:drug/metabolite transporter (DMT)-like permease
VTVTDPRPAPPDAVPRLLPLLAVAFTLVAWASAFVGIRYLGEDVPPGSLSLGRLVVATAVLGGMVLLRRRRLPRLPTRAEWPLLALGGAAWIGVYNLALNASEQRIDAGTAALIVQVGPVLVALLATFLLREPLTRWLVVGLGVGFLGVVVIGRASSSSGTGDLVGVALSAVAALGFAVGVLAQKRLLGSGMTPLEMTFWYYVVGTVCCLPWAGELVAVLGTLDAGQVGWLVYLGVIPSAVAFSTWAYALSHADAGRFALTTFLVPFITTLMAWLLLAEVPPPLAFVGGALCIAGVLLTRRTTRVRAAPEAPAATPEGPVTSR